MENQKLTVQVKEKLVFKNELCSIIETFGGRLASPNQFGMEAKAPTSECLIDFQANYALVEECLILKNMTFQEKSGNYLPIGRVNPEIYNKKAIYNNIGIKIIFTGKLRIAKNLINIIAIREKDENPLGFVSAIDITLDHGLVKNVENIFQKNQLPRNELVLRKEKSTINVKNEINKLQEEIEEKEFKQLVSEMIPYGFNSSAQLSAYIIKNRLGYKYKNISGILEMKLDGDTWNFEGGFPKSVYSKLCKELGLNNQKTRATAGRFQSFQDLESKHIK